MLRLYKKLVRQVRERNPGTPLFWIETTPTPSRWGIISEIRQANGMIREYSEKHPGLYFVDTYASFMNPQSFPVLHALHGGHASPEQRRLQALGRDYTGIAPPGRHRSCSVIQLYQMMEQKRTLLTYHDLAVEVETYPGQELIDHMLSTILGQPGSFRYQHVHMVDMLTSPGENYYMYLRKGGKMLGSVGFVGRHTQTGGVKHDSWMIRYFSIKAPLGTPPRKRKAKADLKEENKRSTVLGRFIQPVMADPSQLRGTAEDPKAPAIVYALIEQKNLRSMNFSSQMGLETVGEVATFSFSRMQPKRSPRIEQLAEQDNETMLGLLNSYYKDYTLFFPSLLLKDNGYYVIRESGRIVAGMQVFPVKWRIVDFGSGFVNRIIRLLTRVPWMKRRINPVDLNLLAFDGIYCEKGHESDLYELMEGVLEQRSVYVALLMMDKASGLYSIFTGQKRLGILHALLGSFTADVRMRFINMPPESRQYFIDHPTYMPTYDNS